MNELKLKYTFVLLLLFFIIIKLMYLIGYSKINESNNKNKEEGKLLFIFATIFLVAEIIIGCIGYKKFFL